MYVVCVTVKVKSGWGEAFLEAAHRNRIITRTEPGNLRFDVLRGALPTEVGQPEDFFLFEVYRTAEDFPAHQQTEHYLRFRDEVAEMMAEPRRGVHYNAVDADPWGVVYEVERFVARLFARGQSGYDGARRLGVFPTEIVVHLPLGGTEPPERVAEALRVAFPLGRTVQGVDLLTGAVEVRIFYDAKVLDLVRTWLRDSGAPHDISFLY